MDVLWILLLVASLALGRLFAFEIDRRERELAPGEMATGLRAVASIVLGTIGLFFAAVFLISVL